MKVIGLCGGSGSGKGEVAKIMMRHGVPSIDADRVYHQLISAKTQCLRDLVNEFGEEILDGDGILDRKKLRAIVFADGADLKREALNRISHAHVITRIKELIAEYSQKGIPAVLIDAPLLFESGFDRECDFVIAVTADKDVRIARIVMRDGISTADAVKRINSQLTDEYLLSKARYNISNNGTVEELELKIKDLLYEII